MGGGCGRGGGSCVRRFVGGSLHGYGGWELECGKLVGP